VAEPLEWVQTQVTLLVLVFTVELCQFALGRTFINATQSALMSRVTGWSQQQWTRLMTLILWPRLDRVRRIECSVCRTVPTLYMNNAKAQEPAQQDAPQSQETQSLVRRLAGPSSGKAGCAGFFGILTLAENLPLFKVFRRTRRRSIVSSLKLQKGPSSTK